MRCEMVVVVVVLCAWHTRPWQRISSSHMITTIHPKPNEPTIARLGKHGKSRTVFTSTYVLNFEDG